MATISEERKKELLAQFAGNDELKEAVKEVILASIYENGVIAAGKKHQPMRNVFMSLFLNSDDAMSVQELGLKAIAMSEGMRLLENAFDKIDDYKVTKKEGEGSEKNKAR